MSAANVTFYERVEDALQDKKLHAALNLATTRFVTLRAKGFDSLPEADALRDHGRYIRAHTLAHLDRYLAQFAEAVERLGGHICWAETPEEANRYVVELAQARGVKTVVKSKSMISEELEINHELEAAGVRVVETDLGEYIIQLAQEKPSHIIAPVIHKSRQQIVELFREKLNATEADLADVPSMTALARRLLRADFLQADMGISGVNFGVAETGSICLVTNEGNGRLTTTTPRIHVAMMGMERLVPTIEDLGVMLQLLARSATGQKLSVYSNIITGPRRGEEAGTRGGEEETLSPNRQSKIVNRKSVEPDGPDELHIIILDNGRSKVLGSEMAEILYCIRCGACLNICPVYQQIGGHAYGSVYPGPVGAVLTPGLFGLGPWTELPHASSLCGACREVCPIRIDIPRMLLKLRDESTRAGQAPAWLKLGIGLYRFAVVRPGLYRLGGSLAGRATRLLAKNGWISKLPGPVAAWTDTRDFPAFAPKSFSQQWQEERGRNSHS
ncbi:MAG: (Fe-S)-binding protein [Anaerolineae bacterium]|nr:lactate utilization protein [Anaerolineales bacterium]MCQ3975294.1 (Fe-S)-binding protein [Anaerolineae bacterium]